VIDDPISQPERRTFGVQIDYVEPKGQRICLELNVGTSSPTLDNVPIRTSEEFLSRVRRTIPYTTVNIAVLRERSANGYSR